MALFNGGKNAANTATKYAVMGANIGNMYLDQGTDALTKQYGQAQQYFDPLASTYNKGSQTYADALGINGSEGNARATSAFQAGPGYEFSLNQGLDNLDRRAASRGMLGSGNTSADAINYATGVANQEYGSWLDRLGGYNPLALQTAGAQAGLTTGIGDAQYATGVSKAGILNNLGTNTASAQMQGAAQDSRATQDLISGGLSLGAKLLGFGGK